MKSIQKLATELTAVRAAILVIGCIGAFGFAGVATDRLVLPPTVDVSSTNAGPLLERDLCLTISVGDGAASECGDLRLVHELPGVRTLSKERAPVLIYSSGNARPFPIVAANVALPSGVAGLSRVVATLKVNGLERARGAWTGAAWPNASAVRIALGYDASADPTNIYRYTLDVTASYGVTSVTGTAAGEVAVVNRRASYFGSGWWLAGLDQLILDPQGAPGIWIGGDGSVRRYKPAGTNAWTAPSLDRLDTLKRDGAGYARILPGGVKVRFDSLGRHIATRNRLGYETTFSYDANGRLDHIAVPFGASNYRFHYGASGQLRTVDAPSTPGVARTTTIYQNGARVDSIADADSTRVRFQYPNTSSGVVAARTNRLGAKTMFAFDIAQKLVSSKLRVGLGDSIFTTLRPKESTGMATSAGTGAVDTVLAYTRIDGPRFDVADTTLFWLDRFGSPVRIRNAVGAMTSVTRGDSRFPVLATQLVDPGGVVTTAQYDARGNPQSVTTTNPYGDGRNAVTVYQWDATWDEVTSITLPEGEVTTFQYDPANGNRLWQQQGTDVSRRVHFYYGNSYSLPSSIEVPDIAGRDSIEYDSRGNPLATISPSGIRTTYNTDAVGRDTLRLYPIDATHTASERLTYDVADRVKTSTSYGPGMPRTPMYSIGAPADTIVVTNSYDSEGNLLQLSRSRGALYPGYAPISAYYAYDSAGRKVSENLFGTLEKYVYDQAGNVVRLITARSDSILMTYDAANRLVQRVVPRVAYSSINCSSFTEGACFFNFPEREGPNLCIEADTAAFGYDAAGRMIRADNASARVKRTYYPNGALKTDSSRLATYAAPCAPAPGDNAFTSHLYGLSLTYDLDGRRSTLAHPTQYCQQSGCMERYVYDRNVSALDTLRDARGNLHTFAYDLAGRLARRGSPGNVVDTLTYDSESNLIAHAVHSPNGGDYLSDNAQFDLRGKMVSAHTSGPQGTADIALSYSGLGAVTATEQQGTIGGFSSEAFVVDALGNRADRKQTSDIYDPGDPYRHRTFRYNAWNQLEGIDGEPQAPPYNNYYAETYAYDQAGNTTLYHKNTNESAGGGGPITFNDSGSRKVGSAYASLAAPGGPNVSDAANIEGGHDQVYHQESHISYYGADNKLRVFNRHIGIWITSADSLYGERGTFDEYRYDALGRRVLTRTRRIGGGCPGTLDCQSRATRTVWDGDRILYEIRSPGGEIISGGPPPPPPPPDTITHGPRALETEFLSARADTVPDPAIEAEVTVIGYTHAIGVSGIDEPIELHAAQSIFPHTGWRGMLAMGTYANGAESDCPVVNPCDRIDWPGSNVTIDRRGYGRDEPTNWYGTLASSQGEGSGLQYMRNRYYDPTRGQFTQADPIGLGGGLNLYGFAGGDPITYSDPFGLCPPCGANPLEPRHYQPGVLGTLLIGVVEGAKQFWAKHRDDVLYVGLVLLSEGRAVGEEASPLLGRNPRLGTGNPPAVNTDLPGGRPVAKSIFRNQTKGTTIKQAPLENGGVRRFAPDGTQIRMNPNGSTRLDLPRGPTGREKIHFDPE